MLRVRVSTASAEIIETELITAGRRGLECAFEFNRAWDSLAKTVIVSGVVKRDIVLVRDTITVPGECLAREQFPLRIGVYGANGAGEIVIPTIWANFGKILPSARPSGVNPDEVTPDVVAQIQTNSSDALRLAQEVMRRADSGEFDGRDGATGPSGEDGTDGQNGNSIWTTTETPMPASGGVAFTQLTGRSNVLPIVGDIIVRSSRYVYEVVEVTSGGVVIGHQIGDIKGEQGVADAIWRTTASIGSVYPSGYVVNVSDLVGRSGAAPKAGDLVIGPESGQTGDPTYLYTIIGVGSSVAGLDGIGSIRGPQGPKGDKGDTGATGATGPAGAGVPAGGTVGQLLVKSSNDDFDTEWVAGNGRLGQVLTLLPRFPGSGTVIAWGDAPAGTPVFDFTLDANDQVTSGPIWSDIDSALLTGAKSIVAHVTKNDGTELFAPLVFYDDTPGAWTAKFSTINGYDGLIYIIASGEGVANTWVYDEWDINADLTNLYNSKLDNNLGSSQAGKFLVVGSDGAVTTMTLATWQAGSY